MQCNVMLCYVMFCFVMYVCMYVCMYVGMHMQICVCIHIYYQFVTKTRKPMENTCIMTVLHGFFAFKTDIDANIRPVDLLFGL